MELFIMMKMVIDCCQLLRSQLMERKPRATKHLLMYLVKKQKIKLKSRLLQLFKTIKDIKIFV